MRRRRENIDLEATINQSKEFELVLSCLAGASDFTWLCCDAGEGREGTKKHFPCQPQGWSSAAFLDVSYCKFDAPVFGNFTYGKSGNARSLKASVIEPNNTCLRFPVLFLKRIRCFLETIRSKNTHDIISY
jgi:hypothetical protein